MPIPYFSSQKPSGMVSSSRNMAAMSKSQSAIERMQLSHVNVPWSEEYEKMISSMNFSAGNSELLLQHKVTMRRRLNEFNDPSIPEDASLNSLKERRLAVAKHILGQLGDDTNIEAPFFCTWGCQTFIGESCYINRNVSIYDSAPVTIGQRVLIAPGVQICTDTHEVSPQHRRYNPSGGLYAKPITIGDDCWIAINAVILPGITIGAGSTIAAGAIVTKDVEEFTLVGGVPAKPIRRLTLDERSRELDGLNLGF